MIDKFWSKLDWKSEIKTYICLYEFKAYFFKLFKFGTTDLVYLYLFSKSTCYVSCFHGWHLAFYNSLQMKNGFGHFLLTNVFHFKSRSGPQKHLMFTLWISFFWLKFDPQATNKEAMWPATENSCLSCFKAYFFENSEQFFYISYIFGNVIFYFFANLFI